MSEKSNLILITGGARSGKSRFADQLASRLSRNVAYIATGQGLDDEMRQRISLHKKNRRSHWQTIEEPTEVDKVAKRLKGDTLVLIDCLTLLVSNLLLASNSEEGILKKISSLLKAIEKRKSKTIVVTNEVGSGIVPNHKSARAFRDIAGRVNQVVAERADEVYLMVSGIPHKLK